MSPEHSNPLWENGIRVSRNEVVSQLLPITEIPSRANETAEHLARVVMGQPKAMETIARRVTLAEAGFNDPNRPLSSMFFMGPTGVGKTESAHALAEYMFPEPASEKLKIIDCQEYAQSHMTARLIGSPPGYVDGAAQTVIDEAFLSSLNIIVFDEIEKAHPDFHKILLGILDSGRLSVKKGAELNFANSHIIMTSNIGASEMQKHRAGNQAIGYFAEQNTNDDLEVVGKRALKSFFRNTPEFLGRIDDVVVFEELKPEHLSEIFWKFMERKNMQIEDRLGSAAPFIAATQEAEAHFLGMMDTSYGARDLRGVLDREIFYKVADLSLSLNLGGKAVVVDVDEGQTCFYTDSITFEKPPERNSQIVLIPESITPDDTAENELVASHKRLLSVLQRHSD